MLRYNSEHSTEVQDRVGMRFVISFSECATYGKCHQSIRSKGDIQCERGDVMLRLGQFVKKPNDLSSLLMQ